MSMMPSSGPPATIGILIFATRNEPGVQRVEGHLKLKVAEVAVETG